jgi:hypothetical protein
MGDTSPAAGGKPPAYQVRFDLLAFILGNVPYGQLTVSNLLTGSIQEIHTELSWYFDGKEHKVNRAVLIPYVYTRTSAAGTSESYGDYILVGFDKRRDEHADGEAIVSLAPDKSEINKFLLVGECMACLPINDVTVKGLTKDYSAVRPYPYDFQYIAKDPTLYEKLVYWFFGGKFYHLTKMVRIKNTDLGTILIGFQGPSM